MEDVYKYELSVIKSELKKINKIGELLNSEEGNKLIISCKVINDFINKYCK